MAEKMRATPERIANSVMLEIADASGLNPKKFAPALDPLALGYSLANGHEETRDLYRKDDTNIRIIYDTKFNGKQVATVITDDKEYLKLLKKTYLPGLSEDAADQVKVGDSIGPIKILKDAKDFKFMDL